MLSFRVFPRNGKELRTVIADGEVWFVASDVCVMLGLRNATNAIKPLRVDERVTLNQIKGAIGEGLGQNIRHNATLINESGLYRLIMRSDRAEAREFQDWVVRDVLPSLRKSGVYEMPVKKEQERHLPIERAVRLGWSVKKEVHYEGLNVLIEVNGVRSVSSEQMYKLRCRIEDLLNDMIDMPE